MKNMVRQHFRPRRSSQNCQLLGDIKKMQLSGAMKQFFPHVAPNPALFTTPRLKSIPATHITATQIIGETPTICLMCMQVMKIKCEMLRKALNLSWGLNSWPKLRSLHSLAGWLDFDFPYNVDSGCCWSLRNSCNWYEYQYNWYKNPFILSFILRKKNCLGAFEPVWVKLSMIVPLNHSAVS